VFIGLGGACISSVSTVFMVLTGPGGPAGSVAGGELRNVSILATGHDFRALQHYPRAVPCAVYLKR
jgi:hypothetical protein